LVEKSEKITQPNPAIIGTVASPETIALQPNTFPVFSTVLTDANSFKINPIAPTDVNVMKECGFVIEIGASVPTFSLEKLIGSSVVFDWYKAVPSLAINSKYTYVITWESITKCQIRFDKKVITV